jgi:dipeptidyl-peptidase-4
VLEKGSDIGENRAVVVQPRRKKMRTNQALISPGRQVVCVLISFLAVTSLFVTGVYAQEQGELLSVEKLFGPESEFSRPSAFNILWMPDGASFLYFYRDGKLLELWRFDAAADKKELLLDWGNELKKIESKGYEAQELGDANFAGHSSRAPVILSPDGKTLLLGRYGDLFLYDLEKLEFRRLTDTPQEEIYPSFSPDGGKVGFARDFDLYCIDLSTGAEKRLTHRENSLILNGVPDWVYDEELAMRVSYWWSSDSQRIAYIQLDESPVTTFPITDDLSMPVSGLEEQKYPKAGDPNPIVRLGVVGIGDVETVWVDPRFEGESYIVQVDWLPSGGAMAFQVLNRDQTRLDLKLWNPSGGGVRTVLSEVDPAWVNTRGDQIKLIDDDNFLWLSERDGRRHIYLYTTDTGEARQLTMGEWEVSSVYGLDEQGRYVYFQATEKSPLERHLYRVALDGSGFERLTEEEGTHFMNLGPKGKYYIHYFSDPVTPARTDIRRIDGTKVCTFDDGKIPALDKYTFSPPEYFTVTAEDGATLWALMVKPYDFDPGKKYPVIVSIYGGPESQGVRKGWGGTGYLFQQMMTQHGFIIFKIDNRGTAARGREWTKIVHRNLGYWELRDHVEGIKYLKTLPYIDGDRIGIYGGSYGGYMTLFALCNAPDVFKAGVSSAPVTDWRLYDTIYTERYMDTPQDNPEGYESSSVLKAAHKFNGKLLLIHGAMDNNVHMQNSVLVIDELVKAGKQFELMVYPRERHGIGGNKNYRLLHRYHLMVDFFLREL